jgi:sugar phosphate isomerase/epimerase
MYSRREFGKFALAALPAYLLPVSALRGATIDSTVNGVRLGASTYSFRDFPRTQGQDIVDPVIKALQSCRVGEIELYSPTVEPAGAALPPEPPAPYGMPRPPRAARSEEQLALEKSNREALRRWRIATPAAHFEGIRNKFETAGIRVFAYTVNYNDAFTDEELDATFQHAKALGAEVISTSTTLSMAQRVAPFADRHQFPVALHGNSVIDANRFASAESFAKGMALSPYFRVNLDIGHFTAANFDAVAYIRENHEHITHLHIKDRKKNDGTNEQFGDGDTPIKQVLALLKEKKWPIRAFVEYEYLGLRSSTEEVKRCMDYMRAALA